MKNDRIVIYGWSLLLKPWIKLLVETSIAITGTNCIFWRPRVKSFHLNFKQFKNLNIVKIKRIKIETFWCKFTHMRDVFTTVTIFELRLQAIEYENEKGKNHWISRRMKSNDCIVYNSSVQLERSPTVCDKHITDVCKFAPEQEIEIFNIWIVWLTDVVIIK